MDTKIGGTSPPVKNYVFFFSSVCINKRPLFNYVQMEIHKNLVPNGTSPSNAFGTSFYVKQRVSKIYGRKDVVFSHVT